MLTVSYQKGGAISRDMNQSRLKSHAGWKNVLLSFQQAAGALKVMVDRASYVTPKVSKEVSWRGFLEPASPQGTSEARGSGRESGVVKWPDP